MDQQFAIEKNGGEIAINTKLLGGLGVILLVAGIWINASPHFAEAGGMPYCWLNHDGTVKAFYLTFLKSTSPLTKYPIPVMKRDCKQK